MSARIDTSHLERRACVYVRQSTAAQVLEHGESTERQYALANRAVGLGWNQTRVEVIDEDLGRSGASSEGRSGFARLLGGVVRGEVGAIFAVEVSRLARSSMDWQRLLSLCAVAEVVVGDEQLSSPGNSDWFWRITITLIRSFYSSSSISGVKLVNRLEFKSGAVVLQYVPNR